MPRVAAEAAIHRAHHAFGQQAQPRPGEGEQPASPFALLVDATAAPATKEPGNGERTPAKSPAVDAQPDRTTANVLPLPTAGQPSEQAQGEKAVAEVADTGDVAALVLAQIPPQTAVVTATPPPATLPTCDRSVETDAINASAVLKVVTKKADAGPATLALPGSSAPLADPKPGDTDPGTQILTAAAALQTVATKTDGGARGGGASQTCPSAALPDDPKDAAAPAEIPPLPVSGALEALSTQSKSAPGTDGSQAGVVATPVPTEGDATATEGDADADKDTSDPAVAATVDPTALQAAPVQAVATLVTPPPPAAAAVTRAADAAPDTEQTVIAINALPALPNATGDIPAAGTESESKSSATGTRKASAAPTRLTAATPKADEAPQVKTAAKEDDDRAASATVQDEVRPHHARKEQDGTPAAPAADEIGKAAPANQNTLAHNAKPPIEAMQLTLPTHDRLANPAAPPGQPATGAVVPLIGLAVDIAARAQAGRNRFEIRLDPPELGRVDVRLDVDRNGQVTSRLVVERVETLEALQRDAGDLERALQQAGLKTAENGLQFALRDQGFAGRDDRGAAPAYTRVVIPDVQPGVTSPVQDAYERVLRTGAIDIRV